jgi:hypothetical protein
MTKINRRVIRGRGLRPDCPNLAPPQAMFARVLAARRSLTRRRAGNKLAMPLAPRFGSPRGRTTAASRRYARMLVAGCAAVLAATVGATTALAAATWTVRPGGPVSLKSGTFTLKDTKTGTMIICSSAGMSGTLKSGSGLPGTGIGSITVASITQCGSLGSFTVTATGLPWHVNFTSYNTTKRVVTGSVSHVQIQIKSPELSCNAVIDGTAATASDGIVKFSYADGTGRLKLLTTGGNLHFYHVKGCAGLLRTGDPATLSATFTLSPTQTITSP